MHSHYTYNIHIFIVLRQILDPNLDLLDKYDKGDFSFNTANWATLFPKLSQMSCILYVQIILNNDISVCSQLFALFLFIYFFSSLISFSLCVIKMAFCFVTTLIRGCQFWFIYNFPVFDQMLLLFPAETDTRLMKTLLTIDCDWLDSIDLHPLVIELRAEQKRDYSQQLHSYSLYLALHNSEMVSNTIKFIKQNIFCHFFPMAVIREFKTT